mgnify:CR=1 FL=1
MKEDVGGAASVMAQGGSLAPGRDGAAGEQKKGKEASVHPAERTHLTLHPVHGELARPRFLRAASLRDGVLPVAVDPDGLTKRPVPGRVQGLQLRQHLTDSEPS